MRALLSLFLLFCALSATAAGMIARDGEGTVVQVKDEPCVNPGVIAVLEGINPELMRLGRPPILPEALRWAEVVYRGKTFGACWVQIEDHVLVLDDSGEAGRVYLVPASAFAHGKNV